MQNGIDKKMIQMYDQIQTFLILLTNAHVVYLSSNQFFQFSITCQWRYLIVYQVKNNDKRKCIYQISLQKIELKIHSL